MYVSIGCTSRPELIIRPQLQFDKVEQHLRELPDGPIVTVDERLESGAETNRSDLAVRIVQNGKFLDFLGRQSEVFPVENISRATKLPLFVWLFHGKQDTAVPFYGSERFVEELRAQKAEVNVRFEGYEGDHGFDNEETISDGWMKDGMTEVGKYW
jgi:predicted peptidase